MRGRGDFTPLPSSLLDQADPDQKPILLDSTRGQKAVAPQIDEKTLDPDLLRDYKHEIPRSLKGKPWISSALENGELSHSDLLRLSIHSLDMHSPVSETEEEESPFPHTYASISLYEIAGFDFPNAEVQPAKQRSCLESLLSGCCLSDSASQDGLTSTQRSRDLFAEITVRNRKKSYKSPKNDTSPPSTASLYKKAIPQRTSVFENSTAPYWRSEGVAGPVASKKRPVYALFDLPLSLSDLLHSSIHLEFFDAANNNEFVGFVDFGLYKVFENTLGAVTCPFYRPLVHPSHLNRYISDDGDMNIHAIVDHSDDLRAEKKSSGRVRIRVAVHSDCFLTDLLRGPDEPTISTALNITLRMVQYTEINNLFTSENVESSDNEKVERIHPLKVLMMPDNFVYLFSTTSVIEQDPVLKGDSLSLYSARRKIATLLAAIFTAGSARFGPLFLNCFEKYGEQVAQFVDVEKYGEDVAFCILQLFTQIPQRARIEGLFSEKSKLISTLMSFIALDRSEDVQVKSIMFVNTMIDKTLPTDTWKHIFLKRLVDRGLSDFVSEQLTSWHPQLAEECLKLFCSLYFAGFLEIDSRTAETLRAIEAESSGGPPTAAIQKIFFQKEFRLKKIPLRLQGSSCVSRKIYPLSNLESQDTSEAHTPRGIYHDVFVMFKLGDDDNSLFSVTHVIGVVPFYSSPHAAKAMAFFLSEHEIRPQELNQFLKMSSKELKSQVGKERNGNVTLCAYMDFEDESFVEDSLVDEVKASYLAILINPGDQFRTVSHVEVSYVVVVGCPVQDKKVEDEKSFQGSVKRRSHKVLSSSIGEILGLKYPKSPQSAIQALLASPEMMKNLPS
jgi:hypothetical protein